MVRSTKTSRTTGQTLLEKLGTPKQLMRLAELFLQKQTFRAIIRQMPEVPLTVGKLASYRRDHEREITSAERNYLIRYKDKVPPPGESNVYMAADLAKIAAAPVDTKTKKPPSRVMKGKTQMDEDPKPEEPPAPQAPALQPVAKAPEPPPPVKKKRERPPRVPQTRDGLKAHLATLLADSDTHTSIRVSGTLEAQVAFWLIEGERLTAIQDRLSKEDWSEISRLITCHRGVAGFLEHVGYPRAITLIVDKLHKLQPDKNK